MQETDFYERLLSLPDLAVDRVESTAQRITLHCHTTTLQQPCPLCLRPTAQVNRAADRQYTRRQVRDLDMSGRQVWLEVRVRQFVCPDCGRYFGEELGFADSGKSFTHRQAKWIFECCARQPFTAVGALLDVNAKTVERLYYQRLHAELDLPARYAAVRRLGIDEISHRKGKGSYCCVLTDLDRNIALDVLPNRSKDTLITHFQKLGPRFCARIESVSYDMWSAYHTVSQRFFPLAVHVVDRFHVVKALNQSLDALRRKLRREQPEVEAFIDIKWDLFKAQPTAAQEVRLQAAFAHSPLLADLVALRNDRSGGPLPHALRIGHQSRRVGTSPDQMDNQGQGHQAARPDRLRPHALQLAAAHRQLRPPAADQRGHRGAEQRHPIRQANRLRAAQVRASQAASTCSGHLTTKIVKVPYLFNNFIYVNERN